MGDRPQGVAGDCNSLAFIATKADQIARPEPTTGRGISQTASDLLNQKKELKNDKRN